MPVAYSDIPSDALLPLFYAEVTSAQEPVSQNLRLCLIGAQNRGVHEGYAVNDVPYILSGTLASDLFGRGSMLEWMYQEARKNAPFAEIWGISLPERDGAVRATCRLTVTRGGSSTNKGTGRMYIGGRQFLFTVNAGDSTATIASRIASAISNKFPLYVSNRTNNVITLACKWAGGTGNNIRISHAGPRGRAEAQGAAYDLARRTVTATQPSGGSGENSAAATFPMIMNRPFDVFCVGESGTTFMAAAEDFMDGTSGRWSPYVQMYGHMVTTVIGSFQGCYDWAAIKNDPHISALAVYKSIIPHWSWSAALGAIMTQHWAAPPELSRPLQYLELKGMAVGDDDDESFTKIERQQLLEQGMSTFHVDLGYTCRVDRVRTLRKNNLVGDPDPSWADAITMFQAQYLVRAMRAAITGAYPRAALSNAPTGINGFTSPTQIRNVILHEYKRMEALGLVENSSLFSQYLVVERDMIDPNRVNVLMRPDFVNQLRVVAVLVETHLELSSSSMAA